LVDKKTKSAGRAVRVEDVAREAAVSPITVSRTLRTPDKVSPETRDRVLKAVARSGYKINSIASSLRSGQSHFVSVFVASLQNPGYSAAIEGLMDAFQRCRFQLLFSQLGYSEDLDSERLRDLLPFRPAAVIFGGVVRDTSGRQFLRSLDVPVVEMWGDVPEPIDMLVKSPSYRGGMLVGEHVAAQGFRTIAYVGRNDLRAIPRISGIAQGLKHYDRKLALTLPLVDDQTMDKGMSAFDEVRRQLPECDAIIFGDDVLAAGALLRAQELSVAVPETVAIAGYGDMFFARHTQPGLTTVHNAPYNVGNIAGQLIRERLEGREVANRTVEVPLFLVPRGSTLRQ
jgi:LacI family transcriptional regulator, gluconate utilization system Gnt-I transcriptional repressor